MKKQIARRVCALLLCLTSYACLAAALPAAPVKDPYLWLEDIDSPAALNWVSQQNALTAKKLARVPGYAAMYRDALTILTSSSRIPQVEQHGSYFYNLWQDPQHPRGLFRRTTAAELSKPDTQWELLIDIDALSKTENKLWAFGGAHFLAPENRRCLIALAPGGGDAAELREFDVESKSFVADGFVLPAAKSQVSWRDADSLYVATDFGPDSLTRSGYPRIVKVWQRGTALASAVTLSEADPASMQTGVQVLTMPEGKKFDLLDEKLTFWTSRYSLIVDGKLLPLSVPATAGIHGAWQERLVVWLK
jgi:prolyl oligopeptidase